MTYDSNLQASVQEATPEFYKFTSGTRVERYTSYSTPLMFGGEEYLARSIKRTSFTDSTDLSAITMSIAAPVTDLFVKLITSAPPEMIDIVVYRAILSDLSDYELVFTGQVTGIHFKDNVVTLECESQTSILTKKIPRYVYQAYCNHDLFDDECLVNSTAFRVVGTVSIITGASLTIPECATKVNGYFSGGFVEFGNDFRLITGHVTDTIQMQMAFDSRIVVGSTVYVYPGCSGDPAVCVAKFGNLNHYLGMCYIPSRNPCIWGFR